MKKNNTLKFNSKKRKNKPFKITLKKRKTKLIGGSTDSTENSFTMKLINTVIIFYEALFIKSINMISNVIGIDITNEELVKNKMNNIKNILSNPKIHNDIYVIAQNMVIIGGIFYEALKPHMNEIINALNNVLEKSGSKLATTIEKIIVNISKGIPLYGILIAVLDSATIGANTKVYIEKQKLSFLNTLAETWQKMKPDVDRLLNTLNTIPNFQNQLNQIQQPPMNQMRNKLTQPPLTR